MIGIIILGPALIVLVLHIMGRSIGLIGCIYIILIGYSTILLNLCFCTCYMLNNLVELIYLDYNYTLFESFYVKTNLIFMIDYITLTMLWVIITISFIVHIYSFYYMQTDPQILRFLTLLSLFTFSMIILVTSTNMISLFFGWEGVGLCSYLLINFWFTRERANEAAIKAMLVNRIGDIALLMALCLYYYIYRSLDYNIIMNDFFDLYRYVNIYIYKYGTVNLFDLIVLMLIIAAMGKSAQLGLHTWLPDAMEGPTPVSALIHAATMVTAGVFLLIRFHEIIELTNLNKLVIIIGSLSIIFGSITAIYQHDIKKIIAYSTCSQLGYMFVACGLSQYNLALYHLYNHAFFKALLFLAAGLIIHSLNDEQDIRKMGGLINYLPFIYIVMFIAPFSLMGIPYTSGFFSKDLIIELSGIYHTSYSGVYIYILLNLGAFCTAYYSIRLLDLVFFDSPKGRFSVYWAISERTIFQLKSNDIYLYISFWILCLFSIFGGYLMSDWFIGLGNYDLNLKIIPLNRDNYLDNEYIYFSLYKLIPLLCTLLGILNYFLIKKLSMYKFPMDIEVYFSEKKNYKLYILQLYSYIYNFYNLKWFFDILYYKLIILVYNLSYNILYKKLDKNLLELFGSTGFNYFLNQWSVKYNKYNLDLYIYQYFELQYFGIVFFSLGIFESLLSNYTLDDYMFMSIILIPYIFVYNYYIPIKD